MEKFNKESNNNTKQEPDALKKSEVATSDDKTSKSTSPKAQVYVSSTPDKISEQRSRVSAKHHKDQPKPPTSIGVANQLLQPEGSAKAGLVVSTRAKEFRRTPPNQAGPLERKKAFRVLNGWPPTTYVRIKRRN